MEEQERRSTAREPAAGGRWLVLARAERRGGADAEAAAVARPFHTLVVPSRASGPGGVGQKWQAGLIVCVLPDVGR